MENIEKVAAFIVPTGVGASVGGFAGDASPAANMISRTCPLIVNPNVVNAAVFSGINDNMLYTEGFIIDSFFKGEVALRPSLKNKIGVIFDKAIPQDVYNIHINTINAVEAVYGIKIFAAEITEKPVGVGFSVDESGISTGEVENPQTLIDAAKELIEKGAEAIAVVCLFDECEEDDDISYADGSGVDPVGGVEAIISHIIAKEYSVPVAHAPAFESVDISSEIVDKRAAAEYITPTFLPCILFGLNNAPKIIPANKAQKGDITIKNLKALIYPADCLGGLPILAAVEKNIPVIAVEQNSTVLGVTKEKLFDGLNVILVKDYVEAEEVLRTII